jgi:hypothetical protein
VLTGTRRPAAATIAGARHRSRSRRALPLFSPLQRRGVLRFAVENGDALAVSGSAEQGAAGAGHMDGTTPREVRAGVLVPLAARSASHRRHYSLTGWARIVGPEAQSGG